MAASFGTPIDDHVQQDSITYSSAISACEKGGQCQQALTIMNGMMLQCLALVYYLDPACER